MFFFPRDCPRILLWRTPQTTEADLDHWWRGDRRRRMQAHVETAWLERVKAARLYRYAFDPGAFERVDAAGGPAYYVARAAVRPLEMAPVGDLIAALKAADVELHVMDDLLPFNGAWQSSLHFSGSRLRNAVGWEARDAATPRPPRLQLRTERLTLRPFEVADAARVTEIGSDWEVARMLRLAPWPTSLELNRELACDPSGRMARRNGLSVRDRPPRAADRLRRRRRDRGWRGGAGLLAGAGRVGPRLRERGRARRRPVRLRAAGLTPAPIRTCLRQPGVRTGAAQAQVRADR